MNRLPFVLHATPTSPIDMKGSKIQFNLKLLASIILRNSFWGYLPDCSGIPGISIHKLDSIDTININYGG